MVSWSDILSSHNTLLWCWFLLVLLFNLVKRAWNSKKKNPQCVIRWSHIQVDVGSCLVDRHVTRPRDDTVGWPVPFRPIMCYEKIKNLTMSLVTPRCDQWDCCLTKLPCVQTHCTSQWIVPGALYRCQLLPRVAGGKFSITWSSPFVSYVITSEWKYQVCYFRFNSV